MKTLYSIVGMQHRPGAREQIAALRAGDSLMLVRDARNEYDPNAVQVWAGDLHIGFIKGAEVKPVAREMDQRRIKEWSARFAVDGSTWPQVEVDLEA